MEATSERLVKLQKMLEREPRDAFLLYAVGLEHRKLQQFDRALEYLEKVTEVDPGYVVAYQQRGQIYVHLRQLNEARQVYQQGIAAAAAKGDRHAQAEMEGELGMIG